MGVNTGETKNWGALKLHSLGMGGVADPKTHVTLHIVLPRQIQKHMLIRILHFRHRLCGVSHRRISAAKDYWKDMTVGHATYLISDVTIIAPYAAA